MASRGIDVDKLEFELLHLFEPVCQGEARLEIGVQVVVHDLSLADLAPLVVL